VVLPTGGEDVGATASFSRALINLMRSMKASSVQLDDKVRVQGVLLL
jgi:hypothetical protein